MQATVWEFRLRLPILGAAIVLGFWAPWIDLFETGGHSNLLLWLATLLSSATYLPFALFVSALILLAALLAGIGAYLRIWGAASLPPFTYDYTRMDAEIHPAAGAYLHLRNPLPLGMWFILLASTFYMPLAGAVFALPLCSFFLLRLVGRHEFFLTAELGGRYRDYCNQVPPWIPRFYAHTRAPLQEHAYGRAVLAELGSLAVFVSLAVFPWFLDRDLILKALLVSAGIAIIGRALAPRRYSQSTHPE